MKLGTAGPADRPGEVTLTSGPARPPAVVGSNSVRNPADVPRAIRPRSVAWRGEAAVKAARTPAVASLCSPRSLHPRDAGRFGTGKDSDKTETREADFFGDVQVAPAACPDADTILDLDKLPSDAQFIRRRCSGSSASRRPPRRTAPSAHPRYLLRAWENA